MAEMKTLNDLLIEIQNASRAYEDAKLEESGARSRATSALNRLNELQRKFDLCVADMKKAAPGDSDWRRSERKAQSVTG
jgi:hypothetical protein